jgi:hypothetical protein
MPATPTTFRRHPVANKPTPRQLSYLRRLAERTGQTFTYPHTFAEASREIDRLKQTRPSPNAELEIEREIADAIAVGERDAARVRDDEISGHGSSATWAHNRDREPQPSSDRPAPKRTTPVVGKRTELARYTVAEGERIVYGQRIDGVVRVTDRPATPGGRAYLVERGLQSKDELDALVVRDYVAEAQRMDAPPLASSPVDRYLDAVA